jgi:type II secretory pathway pseudopilin PulG
MIVVTIIALLATIVSSNMIRARKRAQASKILDDLRILDNAMDLWALEHNKKSGDVAEFSDLSPYLKQQNKLNLSGADLFGRAYGPFSVDTGPKLAPATFTSLSDVAPPDFWSPYL